LNPDEVVYILKKIADNILTVKERSSGISDLWKNIALCIAINVSRLRGYTVPEVVEWRNKVVNTVKEEW